MKGYIWMLVLAVLVAGSWYRFQVSENEALRLGQKIDELYNQGVPDDEIAGMRAELRGNEGTRIFTGILLTFLSAGLVGIIFAVVILPVLAERFTSVVYGGGEESEPDGFHSARVYIAQGEWDAAIGAFRKMAEKDPTDRRPWVEIAKIQLVNQEDAQAAVSTLRGAIEGQEWELDDAVFLMFRLAEVYDEDLKDRDSASEVMRAVMVQFPETRHSANARSKLNEWGVG